MERKRRGGDKAAWPNRRVRLLFGTSSTTTTTIVATWHVVHVLSHSLVIVHILLPRQQWQQVTQAKLLLVSESTTAMASLIFICMMHYQDCLFKLEHWINTWTWSPTHNDIDLQLQLTCLLHSTYSLMYVFIFLVYLWQVEWAFFTNKPQNIHK